MRGSTRGKATYLLPPKPAGQFQARNILHEPRQLAGLLLPCLLRRLALPSCDGLASFQGLWAGHATWGAWLPAVEDCMPTGEALLAHGDKRIACFDWLAQP